jgi:hypothetical protein
MDPGLAADNRRRRRRLWHAWMMSGFTLVTLAALAVIGRMVLHLDELPATASLSAATASTQPPARVTDAATGLSYDLLGSPWRDGCPGSLSSHLLKWTAGEGAVAGTVRGGGVWHGSACSAPLPAEFRHDSLSRAAAGMARALEPSYYGALRHSRSALSSTAVRIGGKQAMMVSFTVRYPGQHLRWTSEYAAVVVVSQHGRVPAVYYVAVPGNLGAGAFRTLISSLG